jgi:hypothetical protein
MNAELIEKLFAIHEALKARSLPHAFGGAIALAYCVEEPRGTRDLDINVFVAAERAPEVIAALPDGVRAQDADIEQAKRDGQTRLFWDGVPVDIFLNNLPLHEQVASGMTWVELQGRQIPVLDCASLVIFKSFFARGRDWGDIEEVAATAPGEVEAALKVVTDLVGADDPSCRKLAAIAAGKPD